ncbi:MAG: Fe/S biogenesis protein NfuA [Verrucomicrobiales bacterium]|jgi:Fe/S biogenesis protein NfuA
MSDATDEIVESPETDVAANAPSAEGDGVVLSVTNAALTKVYEIRDGEDDAQNTALRVMIVGTRGVEFDYDLSLEAIDEMPDDALIYKIEDLTVVIPADSVEDMRGSTLDLPSNPMQGGLVIRNPNRPPVLAPDDIDLTGTIEEKVTQLLDLSINPALAAHGGFASFVRVEADTIVHVLMGGGCQGCSMSAQTLTEGIKTSIMEAIPEVSEVVDATDHTAGENPFYS